MKACLPKLQSDLPFSRMLASLVFVIFVVSGLFGSCSSLEINGADGVAAPREFDYFKLALQWPGTVCQRSRHCCSSNACCRGSNAPTEFTIHGLWPDYNDGTWPACCTRSSFDIKEISTLLDPLKKYWPSLSCGSPSKCSGGKGSFWGHEWEKHGTCSFPVVHDEYSYFLTTLNVYFKYNVTRVLYEAGYVPSNSEKYPLGGIVSAIENAFHITPSLACSNGAVKELYLCFYKDFKPRDCAARFSLQSEIYSQSSCPKYVSLPETVPMGQIGLFSHAPERLRRKNFNVSAVYLLDSLFITDVTEFISGCMASFSAMVKLELPHVNILSKMDPLTSKRDIEDCLNPEPQFLLSELNKRMAPQVGKLNKALIELLDEYSMAGFLPLDLRKESSIQYVLSQLDYCIQYGEDADVKINDFEEEEDDNRVGP